MLGIRAGGQGFPGVPEGLGGLAFLGFLLLGIAGIRAGRKPTHRLASLVIEEVGMTVEFFHIWGIWLTAVERLNILVR